MIYTSEDSHTFDLYISSDKLIQLSSKVYSNFDFSIMAINKMTGMLKLLTPEVVEEEGW